MLTEETKNYTYNWQKYNLNYKPAYSWERVYNAFQYRTASNLNGYPVVGTVETYWGGGYVYEMRGQKSYLQGNLTLLQQNNWIDRQTRAIIIEFSIFNPNVNLIAAAEIVIEILPTGCFVPTARFDPINLFSSQSLFTIICEIFYLLFIVYYAYQEIKKFYNQGKRYIFQFWSLVEWAIIIFSCTAFALFIYKINASADVAKFFKTTSGYGYYKLQNIVFWNLVLNYSLAFCIALGTLKFLKVFRFNKTISYLGSKLAYCTTELISFSFMFIIVLVAFVQLFHLFYQNNLLQFSNLTNSVSTCFDIMLGKFSVGQLIEADNKFGPIIYSIYNVVIIFILLTVFITIINDSFKIVRQNVKKDKNGSSIANYMRKQAASLFRTRNNDYDGVCLTNSRRQSYKDYISYLTYKVDELLYLVNDVRITILNFMQNI